MGMYCNVCQQGFVFACTDDDIELCDRCYKARDYYSKKYSLKIKDLRKTIDILTYENNLLIDLQKTINTLTHGK